MEITPSRLNPEQPVTANTSRPVDAHETGFAQSIQDASQQTGQQQTAAQPQAARALSYENLRAAAGALPGITPPAPNELGLRDTMRELQTRQLLNTMVGRLTAPVNIADYPQTVVTYAGQLAAQVNHAGFAESPVRALSAPRRESDVRPVSPMDNQKSEIRSLRSEI